MVGLNPLWEEYYSALDPVDRGRFLEKALKEIPDDGGNALRKKLFALRYLEKDSLKPSVDRYLWQCVNFVQLYNTSRFFKKSGRKEVLAFLDGYGYSEAAGAGSAGESVLYWEVRNAAKRYLKTCTGTEYRRSLFGFLSPKEADQRNHMCLDVWKMTSGLEKRLGLQQELKLWTMAVQDEYRAFDPSAAERLAGLSASGRP